MTLTDTPTAAVAPSDIAAPRSPRRLRTAMIWTASALLLGLVAVALLFQASGGRWFIVQTPSMGTFAPVGTLVLTTPTAIGDVRVGDVVSFHPSTTPDETYTHRVVEIADDGALVTQGDINGAVDPWATGQEQLIGVVTTSLPGVGWLAKALPLLLAGAVLVQLLTRLLPSPTHRAMTRILGFSLVASLTVFLLRPFVGLVVLEATVTNGFTEAVLVSTGLLPIRVSAEGAAPADLVSGEVGRLKVPATEQDWYSVSSALHLPVWGWVVFALLCALPLIYTFVIGLPAATEHTGEHGRRAAAAGPKAVAR